MKIKYYFGIVFAALSLASCSESQLDNINKDEAHSGLDVVNAKFQLTDAEVSTVFSTLCGNYAWYISSYTEQEFGTGNNQLKNVEVRKIADLAGSSVFNNEWNSTYSNLFNIVNIRKKCESGTNVGQYDLLGMAETLEALNWGVLTDLHGDIPFKECFSDIAAPKIDSQKDIYDHIFELLDDAQVNFDKGGSNTASQDVIFGGDLDKWKGLAHALKARYLLHTYGVNRTNTLLNQVLTEANEAIALWSDCEQGAILDVFDDNNNNSWFAYAYSRDYVGSSTTVDNLLLERDDPREAIYNFDGYYEAEQIAEPGDEALAGSTLSVDLPSFMVNGKAYSHLFSKSELYFIKAEVQARLGEDASAAFASAVKAAMEDWQNTGNFVDNIIGIGKISLTNIDEDAIDDYVTSLQSRFEANPLKEIFVQKYIAQSRDEQIETYNDIRRCKYVDGDYAVTLTNPHNTASGANRWPLRLPYGDSDVVSNPNVASAFGFGNEAGMYVFTDPVWWAGGKR
jgi:hypothetical protein